jgi:glycosyltransferase involved in cell wall biosynthesis
MKTCVVIPAYNEEKRIAAVLSSLLEADFEVVAIDDGSEDATFQEMKRVPVRAIRHILNLGQGAALRTGTELAIDLGYEIIVHADADGQHRPEDIRKVAETLESSEFSAIIGSRFLEVGQVMPFKKRLILILAKLFSQKILKLPFSDPQSGLRAIRAEIYNQIRWQADDFAHCSEILNLLSERNISFKEIPMVVNYDQYASSKLIRPKIRMGWKMMLDKIL